MNQIKQLLKKQEKEFELKNHNVYATIFALSGYDKKQLSEKQEIMNNFVYSQKLELLKVIEEIVKELQK